MKTKKQRRHTIFIYCEGKTDGLFVQHLKNLYLERGTKHVAIKIGTGGDYSTFITEVENNAHVRDYDEKYILLDSNGKNKKNLEEAEYSAQEKDIALIWQRPCLEGVFLRILKGKQFIKETSKFCKSTFNKTYLKEKEGLSEILLSKLFTKDILETKRREVQELDQLIKLMEEKKKDKN